MNTKPLLVPTIIETIGMQVWLALAHVGRGIFGLGVLQVALTGEHAILKSIVRRKPGAYLRDVPKAAAVSFVETLIWGVGLLLWRSIHPVAGVVFLIPSINVEHTVQDSFFEERGLFSRLFDRRLLPATLLEVLGFAVSQWFVDRYGILGAFLGAPFFFTANLLEHKKVAREVA